MTYEESGERGGAEGAELSVDPSTLQAGDRIRVENEIVNVEDITTLPKAQRELAQMHAACIIGTVVAPPIVVRDLKHSTDLSTSLVVRPDLADGTPAPDSLTLNLYQGIPLGDRAGGRPGTPAFVVLTRRYFLLPSAQPDDV